MSASRRKRPARPGPSGGRDYEVGYGRPPVETQFRKGEVGNPRGRRNRKPDIGQLIEKTLQIRVTVTEDGRAKSMTAEEVIIRNLVRSAARNEPRAIQTLFALRDRYQGNSDRTPLEAELDEEDRKIIERYVAALQTANGAQFDAPRSNEPGDSHANEDPNSVIGPEPPLVQSEDTK